MIKKQTLLSDAAQLLGGTGSALLAAGGNPSVLDYFWEPSDEANERVIDHGVWQSVLKDYLVVGSGPLDINLLNYEKLKQDETSRVDQYVGSLVSIDPRSLNREEQMCYWINLYNALTVQLIVRYYPVSSITKLGNTTGSFGPWSDLIVNVQGQELSLDHIEHKILRPLFNDCRIHFAVNCASIGCPDLCPSAYTRDNLQELLELGAQAFVSHPRGIRFEDNQLCLSSIFDWYETDFGPDLPSALQVLAAYAEPDLADQLARYKGFAKYDYDWSLNAA